MRTHVIATTALILLAATGAAQARQLDRGLITAMDRIGGNLLGSDAFDAGLAGPSDPTATERLRIYLSERQPAPVEIVVFGGQRGPLADSPEPVRAFFKVTVGGIEGLKLEFDPTAGEIIPCIVPPGEIIPCVLPPADLSAIHALPPDSNHSAGRLRPGLVTALAEVGANVLGAGGFDAVLQDPPDLVAPPRLRLFVSSHARIEFVVHAPADPAHALALIVVDGPEILLQFDPVAGGTRVWPTIEIADLRAAFPPSR